MRIWNLARVTAGALALSLAISGCGDGSGSESTTGGSITVAEPQDWGMLDPLLAASATAREPMSAVYDRLLTSKNGEVVPNLVTAYSFSDDNLTLTLTLEDGVTFHDGTPFDAAAVKVNLDRVRAPNSTCSCATAFRRVKEIKAVDETTVEISFSEPDGAFLQSALTGVGANMVSPTAIEKYGAKLGQHPVGTGPFKFESSKAGFSIKLVKNENYWKTGLPRLDSVEFKVVSEPQTQFSSVASGAIDIANGVTATQAEVAEGNESVIFDEALGLSTYMIFLNQSAAPFDDLRARQAVAAATDRDAVNQLLTGGRSSTDVDSPFSPAHPYYPGKDVAGAVTYDLDRAKSLVQEIGGLEFELTVSPLFKPLGEALQAMWGEAGIKVTLNTIDQAAFGSTVYSHQYQAAPFYLTPPSEDPADVVYFLESTSPTNAPALRDEDVDALIEAGRASHDQAERERLYSELNERLAALTPVVYLSAVIQFRASSPRVKGVEMTADRWLDLSKAYIEQ